MAKKKASLIPAKIMTPAQQDDFEKYESENAGELEASGRRGILRRLLDFGINIAIRRAKANDPDFDEAGARAEIEDAIEKIGDGKLWEWLLDGGFEKILEWLMLIIGLFGKRNKTQTQA